MAHRLAHPAKIYRRMHCRYKCKSVQRRFDIPHTMVVASNNTRNAETLVVQSLEDLGGTESSWVVDGNTIVVGVESLDKVFIQLLVEEFGLGRLDIQASDNRHNTLAVVHPDETSGGELGVLSRESGGEFTLVVIIAEGGVVVNTTDIHDNGAGCEGFRVASADQRGGGVLGEETEEEDG